jgi:hypothetical protein
MQKKGSGKRITGAFAKHIKKAYLPHSWRYAVKQKCGRKSSTTLPEFEDFFQPVGDALKLAFGCRSDTLMETLLGDGPELIQDGDARLSVALHGDRERRCRAGCGGVRDDDGSETRIIQRVRGDDKTRPRLFDLAAARRVKLDPPHLAASDGFRRLRARQSAFRSRSRVRSRCRATHRVLVPGGEYPGTRWRSRPPRVTHDLARQAARLPRPQRSASACA